MKTSRTRRGKRNGAAWWALPLSVACASTADPTVAPPAPPTPLAPATPALARTLFVLERQRDDLSVLAHTVNDPQSSQWAAYWTVDAIAATYGASAATRHALETYLGSALSGDAYPHGELEFDVTGTIATILLSEAAVKHLFGAVAFGSDPDNPTVAPPVPAALAGVVTNVIGGFDAWWSSSDKARRFRKGARPSAAGTPQGQSPVWPAWAQGSGTAPSCPGVGPESTCNNVFPNPGPDASYGAFLPAQLRTAYGVPDSLRGAGRSAVVLEWGGTVAARDIETYANGTGSSFAGDDLIQVFLDGANGPVSDPEATLDVETIIGMAPDIDRVTLVNGWGNTNGLWATYLPYVFATALDASQTGGALADVISVSWGACETEWATSTAGGFEAVKAALEPILMTAAAAGVTVAVAAGDTGSTGCAPMTPPYPPEGGGLAVGYPSSSIWVTAIGGSNLTLNAQNGIATASVWNDWALELEQPLFQQCTTESGQPVCTWLCSTPPCRPGASLGGAGGNSVVWDKPPWQVTAATEGTGRTVPDVAFLADVWPGTVQYVGGTWSTTGSFSPATWQGSGNGTSQATPIFASLVLLLNEDQHWRTGHAAPLLYEMAAAHPAAFYDIVDGNNIVGNQTEKFDVPCCDAKVGYDRASGWGSMLLGEAINYLDSLD